MTPARKNIMKKTLSGIALAATLLLSLAGCTTAPDAKPTPTPSTSAQFKAAQVAQLKLQIPKDAKDAATNLSKLPKEPKRYLTAATVAQIESSGTAVENVFPKGTKIVAKESSWHPVTPDRGLIDTVLTQPNGTSVKYVALMLKVKNKGWQLLTTIKAGGNAQ
jgi:hypothetical protein